MNVLQSAALGLPFFGTPVEKEVSDNQNKKLCWQSKLARVQKIRNKEINKFYKINIKNIATIRLD